ncbi:MAG: hypothetical protein KDC79_14370 [Cyclobacteriaceae bacterium]|nr:hypothetical protein [Cyclobacteriaceae bacterium]
MNNNFFSCTILIALLVGFASCDNTSNVEPTSSKYFLKYYGQTGDQEGIDVKETPDGGFIIGGNSITSFGGKSDYLLIKTDPEGNQEWQRTYNFGGDDRMTEVLVLSDGYLIAGTSELTGSNKVKLIMVDRDGIKEDDFTLDSTNVNSYKCNDITLTNSGDYFIVGTYDGPSQDASKGNSFQAFVPSSFVNVATPQLNGDNNEDVDLVFVKGLEVVNNYTAGGPQLNYLVFGYKEFPSGINLTLYQSDLNFGNIGWGLPVKFSALNTKLVDAIPVAEGGYLILSASETGSVMTKVNEDPNEERYLYVTNASYSIGTADISGISMVQSSANKYIVTANINEQNSIRTSSTIFETSFSGSIRWERVFGTYSSYTSGNACVLSDGSIVYTGTANQESQTKVFLVKTKSNGDMK